MSLASLAEMQMKRQCEGVNASFTSDESGAECQVMCIRCVDVPEVIVIGGVSMDDALCHFIHDGI